MPLSQVHAGLHCTVRSVLHGTTISTFSADVRDIVDGQVGGDDTRILLHVSGPAIESTGIGPGFSGSPVSCPDAHGTSRVIGAISEGIGAYGGLDVLATPIQQILGQPVRPPTGTHTRRALVRRARPLDELTVGGLPARLAAVVQRVARRMGRPVLLAPGGPAAHRYAPQDLRPGASLAVALSSGSFPLGAIGTVTYRDGADLWAFGHPLDGTGRRSLFLEDAYVYAIVGSPLPFEDGGTYKLAAPGHDLGTLSGDGPNAVAGRVGALPRHFPVTITGRDADSGRTIRTRTLVADESALGNPGGDSGLDEVAGLGTAAVASSTLAGGAPIDQTGSMCLRLTLREWRAPIRLCERYVAGAEGGPIAYVAASDVATAVYLLEAPSFAILHPTSLAVTLKLRRGRHEAFLRRASLSHRVRPGQRIRVRVTLRRRGGADEHRAFTLRIPRRLKPGRERLELIGAPAVDGADDGEVVAGILGGDISSRSPETAGQVARAIRSLARYDGIVARFPSLARRRSSGASAAYRDPAERIAGSLTVKLRVVKP